VKGSRLSRRKKKYFFSLCWPLTFLWLKYHKKSMVKLPTICANLSSYFPQFFFKKKKEKDRCFFSDKGQLKRKVPEGTP
jgi:hypothetical protein